MSARQLRSLKNLVKASTGADEDDDDVHSSAHPSTMKPVNRNKKPRKTTKEPAQQARGKSRETEESLMAGTSPVEAPSLATSPSLLPLSETSPTEKICEMVTDSPALTSEKDKSMSTPGRRDKKAPAATQTTSPPFGPTQPTDSSDDEPPAEIDAKRKKARGRRDNRARRREAELEDEQLLEAALRRTEAEAVAMTESFTHGTPVMKDLGEEVDLLALLSLCDPEWLDTRRERINRFGPAAVGDMGDGRVTQRRGAARATSKLFPQHIGPLPMFRHSVFATPNRYCWRAFDGHGVFLAADSEKSKGGRGAQTRSQGREEPVVFVLNSGSPEAQRADAALGEHLERIGELADFYERLYAEPYHIPTLLVAYDMFKMTGDTVSAQEVANLALYHLGLLFSRFPIRQTSRHRMLPFKLSGNQSIFMVLVNGMQVALEMGATRTAWELSRFIYSLDPSDPCAILPHLDYMALRVREWGWLVQIYYIITKNEATRQSVKTKETESTNAANAMAESLGDKNAFPDVQSNASLAAALATLPGFFFNAALAKHFLERELLANATASEGVPGHKPSKVLRDMSPQQLYAMHNTEPAAAILARAIRRFPSATVLLFERLGGVETTLHTTPPPAWRVIEESHARMAAANEEASAALDAAADSPTQLWLSGRVPAAAMVFHVTSAWATRSAEIWRAAVPCGFLRRVVTEDNGQWLTSSDETFVPAEMPWVHRRLFEPRQRATTIPAHLLDPHAVTEEDQREYARQSNRELTPLENDALLRFRALLGETTPPDMSPAEQLEWYMETFNSTGAEERMGAEHSRLALFLRTLLPGNSLRDMALRAALRSEGIADPVDERNRQRRVEDEAFWLYQEVEDEINEYGDGNLVYADDEWETEDSWEADDSPE